MTEITTETEILTCDDCPFFESHEGEYGDLVVTNCAGMEIRGLCEATNFLIVDPEFMATGCLFKPAVKPKEVTND